MILIQFKWDDNKAKDNHKKHKVTFEEGKTAFYDPNAWLIPDPDHSESEKRFVLMGMSERLRILIVCHCYRERDQVIRIISARKATKKEQIQYKKRLP